MDPSLRQGEFIGLVDLHRAILHKICNLYCAQTHDRQDLFQEMVLQLWKAYPKFRGEAKISTWLYRIALNTAISGLRKKKDHIVIVEPQQFAGTLDNEQQVESLENQEKLQQLHAAIAQLSDIEKALVMLYLEDKSYAEMEEILGISQNNLRVKMNRIKEKLRKITKQ